MVQRPNAAGVARGAARCNLLLSPGCRTGHGRSLYISLTWNGCAPHLTPSKEAPGQRGGRQRRRASSWGTAALNRVCITLIETFEGAMLDGCRNHPASFEAHKKLAELSERLVESTRFAATERGRPGMVCLGHGKGDCPLAAEAAALGCCCAGMLQRRPCPLARVLPPAVSRANRRMRLQQYPYHASAGHGPSWPAVKRGVFARVERPAGALVLRPSGSRIGLQARARTQVKAQRPEIEYTRPADPQQA